MAKVDPYAAFLDKKTSLGDPSGFEPVWMPDFLFDFQKAIVEWAIRTGRGAILCDCGLGKTPMQLVWAENVARKTDKSVLILTPLAVGSQTIREGEKFGIEARRSTDGKAHRITVTNYERLHLFNPEDFSGVVCDECFASDTEVDTPLGRIYIKDIRSGDLILNAAGFDEVSNIHRREVPYAVTVKFEGREVVCSPNHPWLTQRGWVGAQDLEPRDSLILTAESMRILRGDVPKENGGAAKESFLRAVLLSEMADEATPVSSQRSQSRSRGQARTIQEPMVSVGMRGRGKGARADSVTESDLGSRGMREDIPHIEGEGLGTFRAWGKWEGPDCRSVSDGECLGVRVEDGVCFVTGRSDSRLSDGLQIRLRERREASPYRGGWIQPSIAEAATAGRKEGREGGRVRLDGIEIYQPGDPRLDRWRDDDGKLYFYDLGATRHPSFSVGGCLVHNSSILKSFEGAYRQEITLFTRKVPYRLLATATAAPNDYIELGTSSEALGNLGYIDMLNRFFKNDQNNSSTRRMYGEAPKWRFKGHAEIPFWRWVTSWARACRRPSDLGFDDGPFILPELIEREHLVDTESVPDGMLFSMPANNLREQRDEKRRTVGERCEMVASLVANTNEPAIVWCQLNDEADLLEELIPDALQVGGEKSGNSSDAIKEARFTDFSEGRLRVLITKPKIGAWGLNWQHCHHVCYFPSHSFEQYYQAVRRCWRFGQTKPVTVDIPLTEGERLVMSNLSRKAAGADRMFANLVTEMNSSIAHTKLNEFTKREEVPSWL